MKIGNAKYGFTQKKYWKLKDGESVFRILPPLGELADEGTWSVFYRVHYGYKNSKGKMRVFQSSLVKNFKTKVIEVPDAAVERIDKLKAELEKAKDAKNDELAGRIAKLAGGQKSMYNVDSNHYMNSVDSQGNIGILKLRHKAKQALDLVIDQLRAKGIDPLSKDNGRYFVFTRTGTGLNTTFKVDVKKKKFNVEGVGEVEQDEVHKLSPELISKLGSEAAQLDKLFKAPTSEEIERIVKESNLLTGNSPAIDVIIDAKTDDGSDNGEGDDGSDETETSSGGTGGQVASSQGIDAQIRQGLQNTDTVLQQPAVAVQTAPPQVQIVQPQVTIVQPTVNVAPPTVTAVAPKVEVVSPPTQTTAEQINTMSDADFLKTLDL